MTYGGGRILWAFVFVCERERTNVCVLLFPIYMCLDKWKENAGIKGMQKGGCLTNKK